MTKKIFHSILIAVITGLILSYTVITAVLYSHYTNVGEAQLDDELTLAIQGVELNGIEYLEQLQDENYRLTWIDQDGTVLYDTQVNALDMDNHADRKEIKEALTIGIGDSSRYSDTLTEKMLYSARRIEDGTVLRIAMGMDSIFALLLDILGPMLWILAIVFILSSLLADKMAKDIVKPLNELDLEEPTLNQTYDELSPMLTKISKQHKVIEEQVNELKQKTSEFEQITASMNEGLVVLDKNGKILSMNKAARTLFHAHSDLNGIDFLHVDRSLPITQAIHDAIQGKNSEFRESRNGREYQFGFSCIRDGEMNVGIVILCLDVSESVYAERNRQEFTANVSHELKTPLQSIIGSAELLESGLVKEEDTSRFIGHIKREATRLVSLINDIIRLSQLEEMCEIPLESVDLHEVAEEVCESLMDVANKENISLSVRGDSCVIQGVRSYLYEIIYNLCDNAIRYNEENGKVVIEIQKEGKNKVIRVIDTGIGIPLEHQPRIFERFYRADKSHSKETGGTGLGLSIVKHAVAYHGGKIDLQSEEGKGTIITVSFSD